MGNFAASAIHLPSGFLKIRTSVPKQNCTKNKHQISIECRPTETFSRRQYEKMSVKFKCQIFLPNRNDYNCIGLVDFLFRRTASSLRYYSDWGIEPGCLERARRRLFRTRPRLSQIERIAFSLMHRVMDSGRTTTWHVDSNDINNNFDN